MYLLEKKKVKQLFLTFLEDKALAIEESTRHRVSSILKQLIQRKAHREINRRINYILHQAVYGGIIKVETKDHMANRTQHTSNQDIEAVCMEEIINKFIQHIEHFMHARTSF